jgi:CheY-like chemotaxis protein
MTRINSQVKVLIAERALSVADLIARNLKAQGYGVAGIVNSAEKAIEFATLTVPDIVLLDLPIPGQMDAFAAGWKILSEVQCPVVYMTAHDLDVCDQAIFLNPYGFLLKPFTAEELKTAIDQTLAQHRFRSLSDGSSYLSKRRTPPDRGAGEARLNSYTMLDQELLTVVARASAIAPMPRILFANERLTIYTHTLGSAEVLHQICQDCTIPFSYQIFAWSWETRHYQLYAQGS